VERLAGTRHSAALGLAERTDALCIVVSEERGTISAARSGRLRELLGDAELKAAIDGFHRRRRGLSRTGWAGWLRERPAELAGAGIMALMLWTVFVAGARPAQQVWSVPVRVLHAPEGTVLADVEPAEVRVTVSGTRRGLALTAHGEVLATVDASGAPTAGGAVRLPLELRGVRHPARIQVERLHRAEVRARFEPDLPELAAAGPGAGVGSDAKR
jgi:hypothetical protein